MAAHAHMHIVSQTQPVVQALGRNHLDARLMQHGKVGLQPRQPLGLTFGAGHAQQVLIPHREAQVFELLPNEPLALQITHQQACLGTVAHDDAALVVWPITGEVGITELQRSLKQALFVAQMRWHGLDLQHRDRRDIPNFGHFFNHRRQGQRPQDIHQLLLELEGHFFGHDRRLRQQQNLLGAHALRVQQTTSGLVQIHKQWRIVQAMQHARLRCLHVQLPAFGAVALRRHGLPMATESHRLVGPAQRLQGFALLPHQSLGAAAHAQQQMRGHPLQLDSPLKTIRAEAVGGRAGFHQVKNAGFTGRTSAPDRVVCSRLVHDFFGLAPFPIGLEHRLFDGQMEHRAVTHHLRRKAVQKTFIGFARQTETGGPIGRLQAGQPVAHLVLGLLQRFFLLQAGLLLGVARGV